MPATIAADGVGAAPSVRHRSPVTMAGGRVTRDTLIYALGTLVVVPFSLVSVVGALATEQLEGRLSIRPRWSVVSSEVVPVVGALAVNVSAEMTRNVPRRR